MVRVLRDLAAREDLPREVFMGRRFESSFRDFATTRDELVERGLVASTTVPRITAAGRAALEGAP